MSAPAIPVAPFLGILILGYVVGPRGVEVSAWEERATGLRWCVDQGSGRVVAMAESGPDGGVSELRVDQ